RLPSSYFPGQPLEPQPPPLVEAVPALALRGKHPVGLGLHVEGSVAAAPLGPLQAVGHTGVHLAEVALAAERLDPEAGGDDLCGLDRSRDDAGHQDVRPHPARGPEVVAEGCGLLAATVGQAGASPRSPAAPVEAGVGISVTDEDQTHHKSPYGA